MSNLKLNLLSIIEAIEKIERYKGCWKWIFY